MQTHTAVYIYAYISGMYVGNAAFHGADQSISQSSHA